MRLSKRHPTSPHLAGHSDARNAMDCGTVSESSPAVFRRQPPKPAGNLTPSDSGQHAHSVIEFT